MDNKPCNLTVDTGAERTFLREDTVAADLEPSGQQLSGVTGHCMQLKGPVQAKVTVGDVDETLPVYVADLEENLLGLDYLKESKAVLDFGDMTMGIGNRKVPLLEGGSDVRVLTACAARIPPMSEASLRCRLSRMMEGEGLVSPSSQQSLPEGVIVGRTLVPPEQEEVRVVVANLSSEPRDVREGALMGTCEVVQREKSTEVMPSGPRVCDTEVPSHLQDLWQRSVVCLTEEQAGEVGQLLSRYADVFSKGDHDLGCTDLVKHHIHTGDARPIKTPPRRIAPARRIEMEKAVEELKAQEVIEKSSSPWSSAVVLVRKKDGTSRCCVDYRSLNAVTTKDSYPLPRIDDTLDSLAGACWFSTLDLKSGYHQVEMAEEDKPKTAFTYGQGLWQFRVMSFVNAQATFERLMERVLDGLLWKSALVYLDDVLVYGSTFEKALERLETVLDRFRTVNLKLSPKKCCLFQKEVPFLGHVVSGDGVRTDPGKVEAISEWPRPQNVREVRGFLGLCAYYRCFVKGFSQSAAPLHHLTRKGARFLWDDECQEAFQQLRGARECSSAAIPRSGKAVHLGL